MSVFQAICFYRFVYMLMVATGIGGQSPNIVKATALQPARSLLSVRTDKQNVSATSRAFRSAAVHHVMETGSLSTSATTGSNAGVLSATEASVMYAVHKHDRFCEEFCYHMFPMDDEQPTQILRMPCKGGCLRMYSQGAMGACDCDPLEPPQNPKGGPTKQGSRSSCHTFPDPGQGWNWHASCLDLYDKDHGITVNQTGYQTPAEIAGKLTNACKIGWQCGLVMSGCATAETLPAQYPKGLIEEICGNEGPRARLNLDRGPLGARL